MEHLTKQQIVLVTLLVSFVTALATGIFTVSLMQQAPQSVVRTINNVVEKTIERVVTQEASVNSASNYEDRLAQAVGKIGKNVVRIKNKNSENIQTIGIIVSDTGVILADKGSLAGIGEPVATLSDGTTLPISIVQSQQIGDIVFLSPIVNTVANASDNSGTKNNTPDFKSIVFATSTRLGQSVYSLSGSNSGTSQLILGNGVINEYLATSPKNSTISNNSTFPNGSVIPNNGTDATSSEIISNSNISTSIVVKKITSGALLFDIHGGLIGIRTSGLNTSSPEEAVFYSLKEIEAVIPK